MSATFTTVTVLAAAANTAAAVADYVRPRWLMTNMAAAGVPRSWVFPLGHLKLAGALGLLAGFAVPLIGVAAASGLVLFFIGAVGALMRARDFAHLPYPSIYLLLALSTLALHLTSEG
jgi:DoxX-like family